MQVFLPVPFQTLGIMIKDGHLCVVFLALIFYNGLDKTMLSPFYVFFLFVTFKIMRQNVVQGYMQHTTTYIHSVNTLKSSMLKLKYA